MAIGDPWDTSYNPEYLREASLGDDVAPLRNAHTGMPPWTPDYSDVYPQNDPLSLKERRKGRFCDEGCGCIDTGCDNLAGARCVLPPEIAITIIREPGGRYKARDGIQVDGAGETFHLKYSNGSWRGSRCCTHDANGPLTHTCDPCKVTTLPNGKQSECHYANNKYANLDSIHQEGDDFPSRGQYHHTTALKGGVWPRRDKDAWLNPSAYDAADDLKQASYETTDLLKGSTRGGEEGVCFDADGVPLRDRAREELCTGDVCVDADNKIVVDLTTEESCLEDTESTNYSWISGAGSWYPKDPIWLNNEKSDKQGNAALVGTSPQSTPFSVNALEARVNVKTKEKRIFVDKDGYVVDYKIANGFNPDKERSDIEILYELVDESRAGGCVDDGAVPLKKRPWCRDAIKGYRIQQECTDLQYKNKKDCEAEDEVWLYGDKTTCELGGLCRSPEEGDTVSQTMKAACFHSETGKQTSHKNEKSCKAAGHHWAFDIDNCEAYYHSGLAKCTDADGKSITATDKKDCETKGGIFHQNSFFPHQWVDWEYERRSCCGGRILDEAHPFHTPQMSGGAFNTRKSSVCFTPYAEVILTPTGVRSTGSMQFEAGCMSIGNQADRDWFFYDKSSYWTLLIRPCNFWGSCYEENVLRPDPGMVANSASVPLRQTGGKDNYYETTCGEEVVLMLPVDQFLNCSNFNLTLSDQGGAPGIYANRSGWKESQALWNPKMGNLMGNPAGSSSLQGGFPLTAATYGQKGFPGNAIEHEQHAYWCDYPDADWDGLGDDGVNMNLYHEVCQRHIYWNSQDIAGSTGPGTGGWSKGQLQNAKGADAFYGFNIQPQPFKATEEKQNRAKSMADAAADKENWQRCVDHKLLWNGGGHWFWEYGPDYFFYFDFVLWNEIGTSGTPGSALLNYVKPSYCIKTDDQSLAGLSKEDCLGPVYQWKKTKCEEISDKAQAWIDSHVGMLARNGCPDSPPLYVGWNENPDLSALCPDCTTISNALDCGSASSCTYPDDTFTVFNTGTMKEYADFLKDCDDKGGVSETCCSWIEGCTLDGRPEGIDVQVVTNYDDCIQGGGDDDCIERPATGKAECERDRDKGGAGGKWFEECIMDPARAAKLNECPPLTDIPDGLLNIVLGEVIGTCLLFEKNEDGSRKDVSITRITQSECEKKLKEDKFQPENNGGHPPSFKADTVGSSDVRYKVREGTAVKLRADGPLTTDLPSVLPIVNGKPVGPYDLTQWGLTRNRRLPAGKEKGHSLTYWHETGLWPRGEFASFVNDHCQGLTAGKRIEYASNTKPITITSRTHLLRDGDLVNIANVQGNFAANVMSQGEWAETQWEEKIYSQCVDGCDDPQWPDSVCPYTTKCVSSSGSEIAGKDKLSCMEGNCSKSRPEGGNCIGQGDCENERSEPLPICMADGTCNCYDGYYEKVSDLFDGMGGCVDKEGGCGGKWTGAEGNEWQTYCDHDKFYACAGTIIKGKSPPPADFFVAKNVTVDTFDLYTCDKYPVDGTTKHGEIEVVQECPEELGNYHCVKDAGTPYNDIVTAATFSVTKDPDVNFGLATIGEFTPRCVSVIGVDGANEHDKQIYQKGLSNHKHAISIPVEDAPLDALHTCGGLLKDDGHFCTYKDCEGDGVLAAKGRWITEQNLVDNLATEGLVEGSEACENFGSCKVVQDYFGAPESFMTKDDCISLAKTFDELFIDQVGDRRGSKYTDGKQLYVNRCIDTDGKRDNSDEMISKSGNPDELEQVCKNKHSRCVDIAGNPISSYCTETASNKVVQLFQSDCLGPFYTWHAGYSTYKSCTMSGNQWKEAHILTVYNQCVNKEALEGGDDDKAFKNCWDAARWMPEGAMDLSLKLGEAGGEGKPNVGVWKVCPYTGDWILYNNHEDVGVNAGYVGHLGQKDIDDMYRFGLGGPGYKWEDRANDYYVQIEQKGICPVCCDHFMPETLYADISGMDSNILNLIKCGIDPCTASPSLEVDNFTSTVITNNVNPLHDGFCCSDGLHPCDMHDLDDCEENPHQYGTCTKPSTVPGDPPLLIEAYTRGTCAKAGGTFTQLRNLPGANLANPAADCNMFLRKRPERGGTTNCRRCSDVYSSKHKVPLYEKTDIGAPLDYYGESCCDNGQYPDPFVTEDPFFAGDKSGMLCRCTVNEQDTRLQSPDYRYPTCDSARKILPECEQKIASQNQIWTVGDLKAECKEMHPGTTPHYEWLFTPCSCFPNRVPIECESEHMQDFDHGSCEYNGNAVDKHGERYHNNKAGCYRKNATTGKPELVPGKARNPDQAKPIDCDKLFYGEWWQEGAMGCSHTYIMADADESCYNHAKAHGPVKETCPGLGGLKNMGGYLKYDGVVWRTDWMPMGTVGTHHCDIKDKGYGVHRFKWAKHCQPTGPEDRDVGFTSGDELVAVNADCDGCDMSQYGGISGGVHSLGYCVDTTLGQSVSGSNTEMDCTGRGYGFKWIDARLHRNAKTPSLPRDGHFLRLVMGCGGSIPSIDAYGTGRVLDGGFNGGAELYTSNGIGLWAEITNCTFVDLNASDGLRADRSETGTWGYPPCFPGISQCISKKGVVGPQLDLPIVDRVPTALERKYTFAGKCLHPTDCGPKGPCAGNLQGYSEDNPIPTDPSKLIAGSECCEYTGPDQPYFITGPLWNGAIACSHGGDLDYRCKAVGFNPIAQRPPEQFTVHYVKDVDPVTGAATLVIPAYPPTFNSVHCNYPAGTLVSIGLADLHEAENDSLGSYARNNKSKNPYLPAGGTVLTGAATYLYNPKTNAVNRTPHNEIPRGDNLVDAIGDKGRGNEQFMEIRVANVAPLITKNPRKNRHLRIFDRSRMVEGNESDDEGNPIKVRASATSLEQMNMLLNLDMAQPYGLKPWPVDHQTHSNKGEMWPKGIPMGPRNTESLRLDPAGSLGMPGRVGPLPTAPNLNRMFRYNEEDMGDGTSTALPQLWPVEPVMINEFHNIYSTEGSEGYCTEPEYKNQKSCVEADNKWIPQFLYTKAVTHMANDLSDGEKIIISGSVTYPATCKGARMGFCKGQKEANINECMKGECIDTELGPDSEWVYVDQDKNKNKIDNRSDCMTASEKKIEKRKEEGDPVAAAGGNINANRMGGSVADLVFKSVGEWIQIFEEGTPESSTAEGEGEGAEATIGTGDQYVCENVFGGKWVLGYANNALDKRNFYEDPLNEKPLALPLGENNFNEGCPVGCRLNGFYLEHPCDPPSDANPYGQCFECIDVVVSSTEGSGGCTEGYCTTQVLGYCTDTTSGLILSQHKSEAACLEAGGGEGTNKWTAARKALDEKECKNIPGAWIDKSKVDTKEECDRGIGGKWTDKIKGSEKREMKCPLGPADGNYIARKRGCQHADYSTKATCEANGWAWFGNLRYPAHEIALHRELQIPIHDASKLRSKIMDKTTLGSVFTPSWEYDLSNTPKRVTTDGGFTGESVPLRVLDESACNGTRGAAWSYKAEEGCFDSKTGNKTEHLTQDSCKDAGHTWRVDAKGCVDLSRLDVEFPAEFSGGVQTGEIYDLCTRSENCHFIKKYGRCMDISSDAVGTCLTLEGDGEDTVVKEERTTSAGCVGVFVGPNLELGSIEACLEGACRDAASNKILPQHKSERTCKQAGGENKVTKWGEGAVEHAFHCHEPELNEYRGDFPSRVAETANECINIARGSVVYAGTPHTITQDKDKTNMITHAERLVKLSSPAAVTMGHDVGIGPSVRKFMGVMYAPQIDETIKEHEGFKTTYADPEWRAVWSRHGGSFDILVGYPAPENNCRDGNSNRPTSLDFFLDFPQICCNDRGPLNFWGCGDKCYHHYMGPHLTDLGFNYGLEYERDSVLFVNIHEDV